MATNDTLAGQDTLAGADSLAGADTLAGADSLAGADTLAGSDSLAGQDTLEAQPKEPKKEEPKPKDWRDKRIATLTAKLAEAQNKPAPAPVVEKKEGESQADFEARVAAETTRRVAYNEQLAKYNEVGTKAKEVYGTEVFDTRLKNIQATVNQNDPIEVAAYNRFLEAGLATGQLGKLIFVLGDDQNRVAELMAMGQVQMAVELTKLAGLDEAGEVTKAPKPIAPVDANNKSSRTEIDPTDPERADTLSTAEWMRRRDAQVQGARR